jgi:hypothetical protein
MLNAFFKNRQKSHSTQGITCPSLDYPSYILMRDKNGNELLVENNCTHLPKNGPRIHPELIYEKRKKKMGRGCARELAKRGAHKKTSARFGYQARNLAKHFEARHQGQRPI